MLNYISYNSLNVVKKRLGSECHSCSFKSQIFQEFVEKLLYVLNLQNPDSSYKATNLLQFMEQLKVETFSIVNDANRFP